MCVLATERNEEFVLGVFDPRGQIRTDNGTQGIDDFKYLFDEENALKEQFMQPVRNFMMRCQPVHYSDVVRLFYASEMQRITGTPAGKLWG